MMNFGDILIYVTGATGHIGNNLIRLLNTHNYPYKIFARSITTSIIDFKENVIIGDIFDITFISKYLKKGDTLVHLAAFIDIQNDDLDQSIYVNDYGTRQLIDYASLNNIYLIYTSSVDVIPRKKNQVLISEPDIIQLNHLHNYALTKAKATNYLLEKMKNQSIQACIFYPTAVIGPHDYRPSSVGKEIVHALNHPILFYVNGGYNFIDVRDVSKYLYEAIIHQHIGSYIIGNQSIKIRNLYQLIKKKDKTFYIYIPKWIAYIGIYILKNYSKVMLDAVYDNYNYDLSLSVSHFGIKHYQIRETVNDTVEWFQKEKR